MKKVKTIFIAEDSQNVRENLKKIIGLIDGLKIVGESETLQDSLNKVGNLKPDICIIDIGLPDGNGMDILKYLTQINKQTKTIIFTNYTSTPYRLKCNKLGADHFLDKNSDFDSLSNILFEYVSN